MTEEPKLEGEVTNLQAFVWGVLMEARFTKKDMLEILDETVDAINDDFILYDSSTSTKKPPIGDEP